MILLRLSINSHFIINQTLSVFVEKSIVILLNTVTETLLLAKVHSNLAPYYLYTHIPKIIFYITNPEQDQVQQILMLGTSAFGTEGLFTRFSVGTCRVITHSMLIGSNFIVTTRTKVWTILFWVVERGRWVDFIQGVCVCWCDWKRPRKKGLSPQIRLYRIKSKEAI